MANLSDRIESKFIAYAVDLSRLEEETAQRVLYFLKLLEKELAQDIEEGLGTAYSQAKLAVLKKQIKETIQTAYNGAENALLEQVNQLPAIESKFILNTVNSAIGADLMTTALTPGQLKGLTDKTLIMGAPSAVWWADQPKKLQSKFMVEMQLGIARGEPINLLTQRVRGKVVRTRTGYKTKSGKQRFLVDFKGGIMDLQTRDAKALIRTSIQTLSNSIRNQTFKANADVIKGQAWLSTLDMRTTPICQALDGLEWDLKGEGIGHSEPFSPPPAHWNCRSCLVPILKSWKELSRSKSPDLKKKLEKLEKRLPESTRASVGGQISSRVNYTEWFDGQPHEVQLEILGPTKLKFYEEGHLSFRQMIDQIGNPLTIPELQQKVLS
jgi:SPP1 gp7 family putative phage head morphogenesis protein